MPLSFGAIMHTRSCSFFTRSAGAALALSSLFFGGCGGSAPNRFIGDPGSDMGTRVDLAMTAPDMAQPEDMAQPGQGSYYRYAMNNFTLPQTRTQLAIDLNGDGRLDNQLGNIIGVLASQGLSAQTTVDQSVARGDVVELLRLRTADATLTNDNPVPVVAYAGKPMANPDFSGAGSFTVDNGVPAAPLNGTLAAAAYASEDPITTTKPVTLQLKLPLFAGGAPVPMILNGAHIQFTTSGAQGGLMAGQINGSIKDSDVQGLIVPAIAVTLTAQIQKDPNSAQSKQLESLFDTGGCGAAKANDGIVDACEVATNPIIMAVLAPDVQIYDNLGAYAPNKTNMMKDSLSVSIGFTAVRAQF